MQPAVGKGFGGHYWLCPRSQPMAHKQAYYPQVEWRIPVLHHQCRRVNVLPVPTISGQRVGGDNIFSFSLEAKCLVMALIDINGQMGLLYKGQCRHKMCIHNLGNPGSPFKDYETMPDDLQKY